MMFKKLFKKLVKFYSAFSLTSKELSVSRATSLSLSTSVSLSPSTRKVKYGTSRR